MINDQVLREAVEHLLADLHSDLFDAITSYWRDKKLEDTLKEDLGIVVELAQSYLLIAGKMPETKMLYGGEIGRGLYLPPSDEFFNKGYNQARQDMLLAFMKMMPSGYEIVKLVEEINGTVLSPRCIEEIHNLIMERMK